MDYIARKVKLINRYSHRSIESEYDHTETNTGGSLPRRELVGFYHQETYISTEQTRPTKSTLDYRRDKYEAARNQHLVLGERLMEEMLMEKDQ